MRYFGKACLAIPLAVALAPAAAGARPICHTTGATQFVDAIRYCVSSVLAPVKQWTYGPDHLVEQDGDGRLAWCEGAKGNGVGETVLLRIDGGVPFRRLWIGNGYGKSVKSYTENGRARRIRLTSDLGLKATIELPDASDAVAFEFPEPVAQRWIKLKVLSVYPGTKYRDMCLDFIAPDFDYEEALLQQRQRTAPPAAAVPAQPAEPPGDLPDLPPPSAAAPGEDPFGDLGFPDDDDLDLN